MNYSSILTHLTECGYKVSALKADSAMVEFFTVELEVNGLSVTLLHVLVDELSHMPSFLLANPYDFPRLAHTTVYADIRYANICVNVPDAVSVNYERPELAFEESLRRHVLLLQKLLSDNEWNTSELLREFEAGWLNISDESTTPFIYLSTTGSMEALSVVKPRRKDAVGLSSCYVGYKEGWAPKRSFSPIYQLITAREVTKGHGFVVPLNKLTPAPWKKEELADWYLNLLADLPQDILTTLTQQFAQQRAREFWLIFNGPTPSGTTWFGINFVLKSAVSGRKNLPFKKTHLDGWELKALPVSTFSKEKLMPRSGANESLLDKKVLMVGCGSVGGDVADKLAASGVGHITISDPDSLSLNNIYRHILPLTYVSYPKSLALWPTLVSKYPWLEIVSLDKELLDLRDRAFISGFDLIIIAIGVPTQERMFHDYLLKEKINVPVINTWVEGYGIGGHVVLDLPDSKGCLRCAYVDPDNFSRGLSSNLNFLAPNQDLTKNHAGCGDAFLPYTYIASTQTAVITADISVKYLLGKVNVSSRISWKGSSEDATEQGFTLSGRYHSFRQSLEMLHLFNTECDICNG